MLAHGIYAVLKLPSFEAVKQRYSTTVIALEELTRKGKVIIRLYRAWGIAFNIELGQLRPVEPSINLLEYLGKIAETVALAQFVEHVRPVIQERLTRRSKVRKGCLFV